MANFKPAFDKTMGHEGGYVNDPADRGGETYRGISRRHHPEWPGWETIDKIKALGKNPGSSDYRHILNPNVEALYKDRYWNPLALDEVASQAIAEELFDTAVNMGVQRAGIFLQRSLNVLNKNGTIFQDLAEDGKPGPKTLAALRVVLGRDGGERAILVFLNVCQGMHYMDFMKKSPDQERFAWGWVRRVAL